MIYIYTRLSAPNKFYLEKQQTNKRNKQIERKQQTKAKKTKTKQNKTKKKQEHIIIANNIITL